MAQECMDSHILNMYAQLSCREAQCLSGRGFNLSQGDAGLSLTRNCVVSLHKTFNP